MDSEFRRFAQQVYPYSHHPSRSSQLDRVRAENSLKLDKTQTMVLPYAAGKALALADTAHVLSQSTRYYYETGRSRPVRGNFEQVLVTHVEAKPLLQPWLEREDFLDTITSIKTIRNDR